MKKYSLPGLRLGGTSFLLHAPYVPAVRFTAERCDDVSLLLTGPGDAGKGLPSREEIRELHRILDGEGATLHVHLPTDADCGTPQSSATLLDHVRLAVERSLELSPHSFVLHLDFPALRGTGQPPGEAQVQRAAGLIRAITAQLPRPAQLAIENLEGFPPAFWDRWLEDSPCSRCFDIGHVWKDGGDPAPLLPVWLPRTRVIHLHGIGPERDHASLAFTDARRLDAVMHPLWDRGFSGVLTLEVFTPEDFATSHAALLRSWERRRTP